MEQEEWNEVDTTTPEEEKNKVEYEIEGEKAPVSIYLTGTKDQVESDAEALESGDFSESLPQGKLVVDGTIMPLLAEICRVFVPLMQQNYQAYLNYQEQGETLFNEKAFWQNRSLYKGQLDGTPFQTVVKSFQVRTWLDLRKQWDGLESAEKEQIEQLLPANHGLDHDLYA